MKEYKYSPKISILSAIAYIAIMGIGMYTMHHVFNYAYDDANMVKVLIFVEIILSGFAIFVTNKFYGWKNIGFKKINFKKLIWFVPHLLVVISMLFVFIQSFISNIDSVDTDKALLIALVGLTTLLVGFSEEVMFRGIVLRGFTNKGKLYTGLLASSFMFALLHSVNVFGGLEIQNVQNQLVMTFIAGAFFAPLAIKLNNIIPIIIFHWIWDFTLVASPIIGSNANKLSMIGIFLNVLVGILLWLFIRRKEI